MPSVDLEKPFLGKLAERADCIAGGHIAHIRQVFAWQQHR